MWSASRSASSRYAVLTTIVTPSPSTSPDQNGGGFTSDGWFIAAIILIAVALIVGGIWLYIKNREDKVDDEDENTDDNNLF